MLNSFSPGTCVILSGLFIFLANACVKGLTAIPPSEILFVRSVISITFTYFLIRRMKISAFGNNRPMLVVRGLAGNFGILLNFMTLQMMPIASAVTIQYTLPIMTVIFAAVLLKERPTARQVPFILIAFLGVLMIKGFDPRVSAFGVAIGLLSAASNAFALTIMRKLKDQDHALVVMFYLPLIGIGVFGPYAIANWVPPHGIDFARLAVIGVLFQVGQYFLTQAFQKGKAANIANLNYLSILYAVAVGLIFFQERIEPLAFLGMTVIIGSAILNTRLARPATK